MSDAGERELFDIRLLSTSNVIVSVLLFAATVTYLSLFPRNLGHADEGLYLYEAKRILQGEVLYRDVFDFVAPGSWYAMALLYWIFGTSIETARMSMAVLQGGTVVMIFFTGRLLGLRTSFALAVPVAYIALCQPTWPFASPHWFSTFLSVLLLFTVLQAPWPERPRWAIVPGISCGLLIAVQQQKGCISAAGVALLFLLLQLLAPRLDGVRPWRLLAVQLTWFGAGVGLVIVPVFAIMIAAAGWKNVYDALVAFPLFNYRKAIGTSWGSVSPFSRPLALYTYPQLLRGLPLILPVLLMRALWYLARGADRARLRATTTLLVFGLFSIVSIMYYPDFIHIAFIAPMLFLAVADTLERALVQLVRQPRRAWVGGWVLALLVLVPLARKLSNNLDKSWAQYGIPHETAFGLVHFHNKRDIDLIEGIRAVMSDAPARELFCYPVYPALYLTTDTHNPTPFQLLRWGGYNPPDHMQRVLEILRTKEVPYVVILIPLVGREDPILRYVLEHYDHAEHPRLQAGALSGAVLFKRRQPDDSTPTAE